MTYPRCYGVCQMWIIRIYPGVDYRHGYAFARGLTVQCFEVEERVGPGSVIDVVFDAGLALCLRVCRCGAVSGSSVALVAASVVVSAVDDDALPPSFVCDALDWLLPGADPAAWADSSTPWLNRSIHARGMACTSFFGVSKPFEGFFVGIRNGIRGSCGIHGENVAFVGCADGGLQ